MAINKTTGGLMLMSLYKKTITINTSFLKQIAQTAILAFVLIFINSNIALASLLDKTYKLGAGDKIQIIVYGEQDLSINELLINTNETFNYPYLGLISTKNKTPQQLKIEIESGLKGDYLINPKIMVNIINFRQIYINGEVKKPGGYEYQPGLTVDKAIALAGGFTDRASRKSIKVKESENREKSVNLNSEIKPGDIIIIDQSFF